MAEKALKTEDQWRRELTPIQFEVCRRGGTEPPFSGRLLAHQGRGVYFCVCCGNRLFSSEAKFDSGTGWPSFSRDLPGAVRCREDARFGVSRTAVLCARCDAHLGHVFDDGPLPTGRRFCMNSVCLGFESE
ncbi:MAG: peptide-methionine (R)-S-oxide reductase MsrB [Desulfovibrionaceae bacterium]|nr:peptide-methionine (R)-S-oxide reductase MsrB [Desulfovibrionaceae bacterium]